MMNRGVLRLPLSLTAALLLAACATTPRPDPLSVDEIRTLSAEDTPSDQIIDTIRDSRATYRLSGSELADLRDAGVADEVIDAMHETHLQESYRRGLRQGQDFHGPGFKRGFHRGGFRHARLCRFHRCF